MKPRGKNEGAVQLQYLPLSFFLSASLIIIIDITINIIIIIIFIIITNVFCPRVDPWHNDALWFYDNIKHIIFPKAMYYNQR